MADTPPLTPDTPTARRWLQDELAKREYRHHESWTRRLARWLSEHLSGFDVHVGGGTVPGTAVAIVALGLIAVVGVISWRRFRPSRPARTAPSGENLAVFDSDLLGADAYLRRAENARDDARLRLIETFRAMAARAHERGLVTLGAETTVGDLVTALAPRLAGDAARLERAGRLFERVRYGGSDATQDDVALVLTLEHEVREVPRASDADRRSPSGAAHGGDA